MDTAPTAQPFDPRQLAALLPPLLNYARSRIRNPSLAEDAVSETLLAALETPATFHSAAQAQSWMYGVLRHKLVDELRRQGREVPASDTLLLDDSSAGSGSGVGAGVGVGVWSGGMDAWHTPEQACAGRQFVDFVSACCDALPAMQQEAFVLRELLGLAPAEICARLGISEGNLWILVYRARRHLRHALNTQWAMPLPAAAPATRRQQVGKGGRSGRRSAVTA